MVSLNGCWGFHSLARQDSHFVADSHPSKGALRAGYATGGWVNLLAQSKTVEMGDQTWYLGRPWARVPWPVTDCEGSNHRRALRQLTYVVTIRTIITAILRTSTITFLSVVIPRAYMGILDRTRILLAVFLLREQAHYGTTLSWPGE